MSGRAMELNLDGKRFRSVSNTANGEVGAETTFLYRQHGDIITATYSGGLIVYGHLLGRMLPDGQIDFRYHHLNERGELMAGTCQSTPKRTPEGRLRFVESWRWFSGDGSSGESEIEEVAP